MLSMLHVPVISILARLVFGWSNEQLMNHFPGLTLSHIDACKQQRAKISAIAFSGVYRNSHRADFRGRHEILQ